MNENKFIEALCVVSLVENVKQNIPVGIVERSSREQIREKQQQPHSVGLPNRMKIFNRLLNSYKSSTLSI